MNHDIARRASACIDHIQTRYHEGHRRAIPGLLALAAAVQGEGTAADRGDDLVHAVRDMGRALEQHMFKEEMRLFPMMEQGGNPLIGQLIEDLHREHVEHEEAMQSLRARLRSLNQRDPAAPALAPLIDAVEELANELAQHIRIEDGELFPMFMRPGDSAHRPT